MTGRHTRIEVEPDIEGGWSVVRDRIVDGHFNNLDAANDYASTCAERARRAGMRVTLHTIAAEPAASAA